LISKRTKKTTAAAADDGDVVVRASKVVGELQTSIQHGFKRLEENDHPAAQLIDSVCGPFVDKEFQAESFYSDSMDDSRTISEDETTLTDYNKRKNDKNAVRHHARHRHDAYSIDTSSYMSHSDYEESVKRDKRHRRSKRAEVSSSSFSDDDEDDDDEEDYAKNHPITEGDRTGLSKPLASSFAKRCYFTKSGIGKTTQHYEGLTLTGNVVLMLASAMKLKGCPTICDEDLRRVEQTYPNQFSRLPDELLLSSGWRRISKYCHFSGKPIPDGIPFFRKYILPT